MGAHARLENEFAEDEKCHNPMRYGSRTVIERETTKRGSHLLTINGIKRFQNIGVGMYVKAQLEYSDETSLLAVLCFLKILLL